jgi:phytoene dehydrogenase-like protein
MAKMAPRLKDFIYAASTRMDAFAARFKNPFLRKSFANLFYANDKMVLIALVMTLAPMYRKAAGYPLGGSLAIARAMEKRFLDLGGVIRYSSTAEKILTEGGRATGLRIAARNGKAAYDVAADYVVSAADMEKTLFSLLDGTRLDETHRLLFDGGETIDPAILVTFGVGMDFSAEADRLGDLIELDEPIELEGKKLAWLGIRNYSHDPSMAPRGKSVVGVFLFGNYDYWKNLAGDRKRYDAEKARLASACADVLEKRRPGFKSKIEMTDVATPLTFERFTGNRRGAYMTWMLPGSFQRKYGYVRKTVPGLDGFWLASMWTNAPGGLPGAAQAGREVAQLVCANDGKRFVTSRAR